MDFYVEREGKTIQIGSADYSSIAEDADAVKQSVAAARQLIEDGLPEKATRVSFVVKKS